MARVNDWLKLLGSVTLYYQEGTYTDMKRIASVWRNCFGGMGSFRARFIYSGHRHYGSVFSLCMYNEINIQKLTLSAYLMAGRKASSWQLSIQRGEVLYEAVVYHYTVICMYIILFLLSLHLALSSIIYIYDHNYLALFWNVHNKQQSFERPHCFTGTVRAGEWRRLRVILYISITTNFCRL